MVIPLQKPERNPLSNLVVFVWFHWKENGGKFTPTVSRMGIMAEFLSFSFSKVLLT